MPSKTEKQKHFMQMSASPEGRKRLRSLGKKPAPVKVAKEFIQADKKQSGRKKKH